MVKFGLDVYVKEESIERWIVVRMVESTGPIYPHESVGLGPGQTIEAALEAGYDFVVPKYFATKQEAEEEASRLNVILDVMEP